MRTTVRLNDQLLAEAKQLAAQNGQSLTSVIEDALRLMLARHQEAKQKRPVQLPTMDGDGLVPGVDLDNSTALWELMDQSSGPARR